MVRRITITSAPVSPWMAPDPGGGPFPLCRYRCKALEKRPANGRALLILHSLWLECSVRRRVIAGWLGHAQIGDVHTRQFASELVVLHPRRFRPDFAEEDRFADGAKQDDESE